MKRVPFKKRPKWASKLTARVWRELHDCQGGVPRLRNLLEDVRLAKDAGVRCLTCSAAVRMIQGSAER